MKRNPSTLQTNIAVIGAICKAPFVLLSECFKAFIQLSEQLINASTFGYQILKDFFGWTKELQSSLPYIEAQKREEIRLKASTYRIKHHKALNKEYFVRQLPGGIEVVYQLKHLSETHQINERTPFPHE